MNNLSNIKLTKYKKLLNKKYRQQYKLFIIEGLHLIEEALKIKDLVLEIITSDLKYKNKFSNVLYTSYKNIKLLSTTEKPQEYVAICNMLKENKISTNKILVMNKINDPGNLGTIIRSAYSFGIKDIIVEGVDIYNSKVLRSSQGSIFNVNIYNDKDLINTLKNLKKDNYKLIGSLLENASDYNQVKINDKKIVIIVGNEAKGIEEDIIKLLDYKVYIPIKFESLNVAVATGILLSKYCDK